MAKLPKWQRDHIAVCVRAFALDDPGQRLYTRREDVIADAPDSAGYCQTSARYQRATITVRRDLTHALGYEVLTHELLHGARKATAQAVDRIIALVPEALRDHALDLWQDADEADTTRLARGLTPFLRKKRR